MSQTLFERMKEDASNISLNRIRSQLSQKTRKYFDFVTRDLEDKDKVALISVIAFYPTPSKAFKKILTLLPRTGNWAEKFNAQKFYKRQKQEYQARERDGVAHDLIYLESGLDFDRDRVNEAKSRRAYRALDDTEGSYSNVIKAYEGD